MNTRQVIGQTITKVDQARLVDSAGQVEYDVYRIHLSNGVILSPITIETDTGEYGTSMELFKFSSSQG